MSVRVMSWVWDHSRSVGIDRLVLLAIADAANDDGAQAWPSGETLARKTGINVRTVQRSVRRLAALGELGVKTNAGKGGANVYRITMKTPGTAPPPRQAATPGRTPPRHSATPAETTPGGGTAPPEPSLNRPSEELRSSDREIRTDVARLCTRLADRIEANGSKRPRITAKWRTAARLLLDTDGKTEQQVVTAIDWCQTDEFWRSNILSMPTLRAQYERLRLAAGRTRQPNGRPPTPPTPVPPAAADVLAALDAKVAAERAHNPTGVAWANAAADALGKVPA